MSDYPNEDFVEEGPHERTEPPRRGLDMTISLNGGGHVRLLGRGLTVDDMREVLRIVEASLEGQ